MSKGMLAITLHAHLPYVFHPEAELRLEERWFFEAITETYIPLLLMMERLHQDQVSFRLTISLTPTLITMMADQELTQRYRQHLDLLLELAEKETIRTKSLPDFHELAQEYKRRFTEIQEYYLKQQGDLLRAFKKFAELGYLELITSAATHAFLPYVKTTEAVRAQVTTGLNEFYRHFGIQPKGMWLPECGYTPELEPVLKACGINYFYVDAHAVFTGEPASPHGTYMPVKTPAGLVAFPRDPASSQQVWSSKKGYPGDFDYREYYRDIGYDLDFEYIKPYIHPSGIRVNTGIKYYRITGEGNEKSPYRPDLARERATRHAEHFIHELWAQVDRARQSMTALPLVVAPYDAELFGHWWYEGPTFLEMLFRKLHFDQNDLQLVTPTDYLAQGSELPVSRMTMSTWGRQGYGEVWLNDDNDWIYPALHTAEERMITIANSASNPTPVTQRVLNQAARELMLAQSSDWAFIMDNKTMVNYAVERTKTHINRFTWLFDLFQSGQVDEAALAQIEYYDHIFPTIDYREYRSAMPVPEYPRTGKRVLFLSWEFPPVTVGGLSRHAYDLSRFLVRSGWEVHVLTAQVDGTLPEEVMEGVHVHRIPVAKPDGGEFVHWAFAMNLGMIDYATHQLQNLAAFSLIHAHDWLVYYAAKALKLNTRLPLVATIHATEHGRNGGIFTNMQRYIHQVEWKLTYEAWRVIVCSTYMQREVEQIFQLPPDKIDMIPNGVDPAQLQFHGHVHGKDQFALPYEKIILFLGRLVHEKGAQVLVEAIPEILNVHTDIKVIFTGEGPMRHELEARVRELGIAHKVLFTGFVTDQDRNTLLNSASVAVFPSLYEPFGIVALEAMAAGTPVVASATGGLADIVQYERTGLTAYPGDAHSFAVQITRLLQDESWARRLADTAKQDLNRYNWEQIALQTISVYCRLF